MARNQTEPINGFKDELFGFVLTPNKSITWTVNYYFGQEHPGLDAVATCGPVPVQPGLCFQKISPAPDGKLHIFDSYVTWQTTPKFSFAAGRRLRHPAVVGKRGARPIFGSAPHRRRLLFWAKYSAHAADLCRRSRRNICPTVAAFQRGHRSAERFHPTYDFTLANGFEMKYEYRRDWSNQPIFLTSQQGGFNKDQNTATMGG